MRRLAFDTRLASSLMLGTPKVHICTVQRFGLRQSHALDLALEIGIWSWPRGDSQN